MRELNIFIRRCFFISLPCGMLLVGMLLVGMELEKREHKCETLPTDNQLIQINDTLYYRIHVRVDTSYFMQAVRDVNQVEVSDTRQLYYKRRSTGNTNK